MKDYRERRWDLFLQIIDKANLDLKGDVMPSYASHFDAAFTKATNITDFYEYKEREELENINRQNDSKGNN